MGTHRCASLVLLGVAAWLWVFPGTVSAQQLEWHSFEKALSVADTTNQWVLVDVYAPWCGWCYKMKRETYPTVLTSTDLPFVLTRLNRDDSDTMHRYRGRRLSSQQLAKELGADGVPAVAILDGSGKRVMTVSGKRVMTVSGFVSPDLLFRILTYIHTEAYRHMSFDAFAASRAG
jgi:thioredoxin-related protein